MLLPLGPTTLFDRVVDRASLLDHEIILATSEDASDDELESRARTRGLKCFRGPLDNVLARAEAAARFAGFDAFARLCGDRPFLPLDDMRRGMDLMHASLAGSEPLDLVTTHLPAPVPAGLTTEIVRTGAISRANEIADTAEQREHVTTVFYEEPDRFRIHCLETELRALGPVHLSVDSEHDRRDLAAIIHKHPALDLAEAAAAHAWRQLREDHSA